MVGAGETAGAVADALGAGLPVSSGIEVVTPDGVLPSRGERPRENGRYPDPSGWAELPERARRTLLATTDRGVFSQAAQQALDSLDTVRTVAGRALRVDDHPDGVALLIDGAHADDPPLPVVYDVVVVATGFDPLWWLTLDDGTVAAALGHAVAAGTGEAGLRALERAIGPDLTVTGLDPPLHLPMLAGLAQGPGFPNLSCLGLLADRVLGRWCAAARPDAPDRRGLAREQSPFG